MDLWCDLAFMKTLDNTSILSIERKDTREKF